MMMPSAPTPDFLIAHPQQLLPVFKAHVYGPPHMLPSDNGWLKKAEQKEKIRSQG